MSVTETMTKIKLKIRIGSYLIKGNSGNKPSEQRGLSSQSNNSGVGKSLNAKFDTTNVKKYSMGSKKRSLSEATNDGQKKKRRKMDPSVTQQCANILKKLMDHPAGWVFNHPVDPVKLGLPGYFDIISEPMDLGTVKRKLNNNEYSTVDGFSAHVRLTFSNAMMYNPLDNNVHRMAKKLKDLFDMTWNALEVKWNGGKKKLQDRQDIYGNVKRIDDSCKSIISKPTSNLRLEPKKPLSSAMKKQKLKKQLLELLREKVPSHLQSVLKKSGFNLHNVEKIEKFVEALGDENLSKLKRSIRRSLLVRTAKVAPSRKPDNNVCQHSHGKIIHKGIDNSFRGASRSVNVIPSTGSGTSSCGFCRKNNCECKVNVIPSTGSGTSSCRFCRKNNCECNKQSCISHGSYDISSHGSQDHLDAAMRDSGAKLHSDPPLDKSEIQSIGDESARHETQMSSCSRVSASDTATTSLKGLEDSEPSIDVQLSTQKALRAASLKNRYADIILKAKQTTTQNQVDKADPMKFKKEKERLERQEQEERARIQAQTRASKETARQKAEAEMKLQRQREREAARLSLQQMVKTVEIFNDHKIVKDLVLLSGCSFSDQYSCSSRESSPEVGSGESGRFSGALEKLGLFIKDDHYMEYEDDNRAVPNGQEDLEEGEIFSRV